jgi:predicted HD phosphohydrolase
MTLDEVRSFRTEPYWRDAVSLRRIDEAAKDPEGPLPPFASFRGDIDEVLGA